MLKNEQQLDHIDIFSVAKNRQHVQTTVSLEAMPELASLLSAGEASEPFVVDIEGIEGDKGLPGALLSIHGSVFMNCVRCTRPVSVNIDREVPFLFVKDEAQANAVPVEDEDWEIVVGSEHMNIAEWVQEEIILSLPGFPQHDDCEAPQVSEDKQFERAIEVKPNPFAQLREMLKEKQKN